jgi:hypothetical protein
MIDRSVPELYGRPQRRLSETVFDVVDQFYVFSAVLHEDHVEERAPMVG